MVQPQDRLQHLIVRLREQGHRLTPQRLAVIKAMVFSDNHLNAEQIYHQVQTDFPMTSLATIYKTIGMLKDIGELMQLSFPNLGSHYDCLKPYPHPHLICTRCGDISDVDTPDLEGLPKQIAVRTGYRIISHRLDFFGTCPQCHNSQKPSLNIRGKIEPSKG